MFRGITYGYPEYPQRFLRNAMRKTVGFDNMEVCIPRIVRRSKKRYLQRAVN